VQGEREGLAPIMRSGRELGGGRKSRAKSSESGICSGQRCQIFNVGGEKVGRFEGSFKA
jgi:hypothetical protein